MSWPTSAMGVLDSEMLSQQPADVACHRALVVAAGWPPGVPGASVVRSDDAKAGVD